MATINDLISAPAAEQSLNGLGANSWFATVAAPVPPTINDPLYVIIPDLNMGVEYKWGPIKWSSRTAPNLGDPVLVVFDNRHQIWGFLGIVESEPPVVYPVTSVFGRLGAVVAATGDYTVAQVTGAESSAHASSTYETITHAATTYAPLASPALTGIPTAPTAAPGTSTTQLATTAFIAAAIAALATAVTTPPGVVSQFAGSAAPAGYLMCDGSAVSRTTYAALFAAVGTTYGAGDGSTTFNLPNLQGRVPVGKDSGTFNTLGATGGEQTHVTTIAEMPAHDHGASVSAVSAGTPAGTVSQPTFTGTASQVTSTESQSHTHTTTATGTVSQPTFTGTAGNTGIESVSHTHPVSPATVDNAQTHVHGTVNFNPGFRGGTTFTKSGTGKGVGDVWGALGSTDTVLINPNTYPSDSADSAFGPILPGSISGNTNTESANHTHGFTPAGTVSQPTFTGNAVASGNASQTHTHTFTATGTVSQPTFTGTALGTHSHTITAQGGGGAHNNLQPYLVMNYIIKT